MYFVTNKLILRGLKQLEKLQDMIKQKVKV